MRIIIEFEPGDSQPVIETESAALKTQMLQAVDGGPPLQDLLDALGEAAGEQAEEDGIVGPSSISDQTQDAGGVPDWLVETIESNDQK
jgi:hypothetical protein